MLITPGPCKAHLDQNIEDVVCHVVYSQARGENAPRGGEFTFSFMYVVIQVLDDFKAMAYQ